MTAYEFLDLSCKSCDVALVHTKADLESMPNGAELLSIYTENDIETYRDVLYYTAQVLGGFFVINRDGKLELRKYGNSPVIEMPVSHRFTSSFSDFTTRYTAVSSTNLRTQMAEYYALDIDDGLTMNLAVNPLLQFGLVETREHLCRNILDDLSVVSYVPFETDTIGNPALDIGDVISFSGAENEGQWLGCITFLNNKLGGRQQLKCAGKNPRLSLAKSKNDKNISGLLNQVEAGKLGIHTFTNASAYSIGSTNLKVISIEFASKEVNHVQFFGQVVIDVTAEQIERTASAKGIIHLPIVSDQTGTDIENNSDPDLSVNVDFPLSWYEDGMATAYVTFELNDMEILFHYPAETWHSGKHILSLYYPIEEPVPNFTNTFNVYVRMENGAGEVGTGGCIASISGQAMQLLRGTAGLLLKKK